jgi:hypothetical protein
MELRDCLGKLVSYWIERAKSENAKPIDLQLVGFIYQLGVGVEPNPETADPWFRLASTEFNLARTRAALEGKKLDESEHSAYDSRMFNAELRSHLITTVHTGADQLNLNLSEEQKDELAFYVVATFERLLFPATQAAAADALRLPETPPEMYRNRKPIEGRKENIVEFLNRVYGREIEAGIIGESDISSLDRSAYHALHSWNALHQDEQFHLEKSKAAVDKERSERLEALRQAALQVSVNSQSTREQLRQVRRLEGALRALLPGE